jgi:hypothetical protein
MARVGTAISTAHAQDFERRNLPIKDESSEDEYDEEEVEMVEEGKRVMKEGQR